MKKIIQLLLCLNFCLPVYAQELKIDPRSQDLKEDSNDMFNLENINTLDVLQALELAGLHIHKFQLGEFDQKYDLHIIADEYVHGKMVRTDTLLSYHNQYHYYLDENEPYFLDYIDQLKLITKTDKNSSIIHISTYALSTEKEVSLRTTNKDQFFLWRDYKETTWKRDEKIPLTIFASSWYDKAINGHRFCGVARLTQGDTRTDELLDNSPHYILISYKVTE